MSAKHSYYNKLKSDFDKHKRMYGNDSNMNDICIH